jgi:hypothetical protein
MRSPSPDVEPLSHALPLLRHRCAVHSFALDADGECIRCRGEQRRRAGRRRAIWSAILVAGTLASGVGVVRLRSAYAGKEAVARSGGSAVPRFEVPAAADPSAPTVAGERDDTAWAAPATAPLVVSTSLKGETPEERDQALAAHEAERAATAAERAAEAQAVTEERMAEADEALKAMRRREASEPRPRPAPVTMAPTPTPRRYGRRHCGCTTPRDGFEFRDF